MTDPDCRFGAKGTTGSAAIPGYTVNALMENRPRTLPGIGVEAFRTSASETQACQALPGRAERRHRYRPATLGADRGYFSQGMIDHLLDREIEPHIALDRGKQKSHARVRMRAQGRSYKLSQRDRKKIEELFGETKDWHGLR